MQRNAGTAATEFRTKYSEFLQRINRGDPQQLRPVWVRFAIIAFLLMMGVICLPLLGLAHVLPTMLALSLVVFVGNLISLAWIVRGRGVKYRIYFATVVDFFIITVVLHYIGGIESTLSWAYAIILIATASLNGLRVGVYAAVVSSLFYSSLLLAEFTGFVPNMDLHLINPAFLHEDPSHLYVVLLSNSALFFIAAVVSGLLHERLVASRNELKKSNEEILEMQETLREHMVDLEKRVEARTSELTLTNEKLCKEIEDRRLAEEGLRNSQERLSILFEYAPDPYFLMDLAGKFINANRAAEELTGYSKEDLLGKDFLELNLVSPDDIEKASAIIATNAEGKSTQNNELVLNRKDGARLTVDVRTHPVTIGNQAFLLGLARDVTERRRSQEALQMSEEKHRTLLDSLEIGFYETDLAGNLKFFNDTISNHLGYPREELLGMNYRQYVDEEDAKKIFESFNTVFKTGMADKSFVCDIITKDGARKPMEYSTSLVRDGDGNPTYFRGVVRDITERRRSQEELEKSYSLVSATLEATGDGILVVDSKGKITSFNQRFADLWRIPESVLESRDDDQAIAFVLNQLKDSDAFPRKIRELYDRPEDESFDVLEFKDGRVFERYSKPQRIGGNCVGRVWSFRDITEHKRADELLQQSEERYRTLFEESRDVILMTTPEGKFIDINPAGVEFYGFSSKLDLLENLNIRDTYADPEDREEFRKIVEERGFVKDYELTLKGKDGRQQSVLLTANAVRDEDGNIVAYRGTLRDITQQRELEQQFFQAQKMESIGTLAGGIAHDFNNILGGILGYASLMKSKMSGDHQFFRYIDTIEKGAKRAAELTAKLLAFARGGKYNTKRIELNHIIDETLGIIGRTFDKSVAIETRLKDDLPAIEADSGQIQQVLMNLCVNAGDAMPNGGKLVIETRCEKLTDEHVKPHASAKAGQFVVVSVSDTGIGMDKDTMQRMFEPFFTTKEEGKGTGLGLSLIYGVVKNHGGFVTVHSEPGEGTIFNVYFPAGGKTKASPSDEIESPPGGNEMILVVDDEEPIRAFAKDALEAHGYRVLLAKDGSEAVELFRKYNGSIGLVILDMVMPNMGGRETFKKLKELNPDTKALLSTGCGQNGHAQEILESGGLGFIQKPYQINTLLSKVRRILDGKKPA